MTSGISKLGANRLVMAVNTEASELNGNCAVTLTRSYKEENAMKEKQNGQTSDRIIIKATDIVSYGFFQEYIHFYSSVLGTWFFELFGKKIAVVKHDRWDFEFREDVDGECGKIWKHGDFNSYRDFINCLFSKDMFDVDFFFPVEVMQEYEILNSVEDLNDNVEKNYLNISYLLYDLATNRKTYFKDMGSSIYAYADNHFGYCRTTTKNMVAIYEKFCDHNVTSFPVRLKEEYSKYKYSQLAELVSVPDELLPNFSHSMSIKDIRLAKKKYLSSLKGTPEKITSDDDVAVLPKEERKMSNGEIAKRIKAVKNPYYNENATEQSARYKAYQKAIEDVLDALGIVDFEVTGGEEDEA